MNALAQGLAHGGGDDGEGGGGFDDKSGKPQAGAWSRLGGKTQLEQPGAVAAARRLTANLVALDEGLAAHLEGAGSGLLDSVLGRPPAPRLSASGELLCEAPGGAFVTRAHGAHSAKQRPEGAGDVQFLPLRVVCTVQAPEWWPRARKPPS